jgi:hypothetical protein
VELDCAAHLKADHHMHGRLRFIRCQGLPHDCRLKTRLPHPADPFNGLRKNNPFRGLFSVQLDQRARYGEKQQRCAAFINGSSQQAKPSEIESSGKIFSGTFLRENQIQMEQILLSQR